MLDDRFEPQWLEGHALLWFDLHGMPGVPWWQGDRGVIALTAQTVRRADLDGALVFALSCYLGERNSPMLEALLDAGARYVVGGAGQNWSNLTRPTGAGLLGLRFRQFLDRGADPLRALALAKRWLQLKMAFNRLAGAKAGKMLADKDALAFRAYYRGTV